MLHFYNFLLLILGSFFTVCVKRAQRVFLLVCDVRGLSCFNFHSSGWMCSLWVWAPGLSVCGDRGLSERVELLRTSDLRWDLRSVEGRVAQWHGRNVSTELV